MELNIKNWVNYIFKGLIALLIAGVSFLANSFVNAQKEITTQNAQIVILAEKIKEIGNAPLQVGLNSLQIKQTNKDLQELKADFKEYRKTQIKHNKESINQMIDLKVLLIEIKNK